MVALVSFARLFVAKTHANLWTALQSQLSTTSNENLFNFSPIFSNDEEHHAIKDSFKVHTDFITKDEEENILCEIEPILKRLRYETDHWDAAILGYRETEKKHWNGKNSAVLQRIREAAFLKGEAMPLVHILDLKADGVIKPHIDSVKFCGSTIAGLSLLTDSIMRLVKEDNSNFMVDILLPRRSLYIMTGCSRYKYTHAILGNDESIFNGSLVKKDRRISVICRNEPCYPLADS